jgi:DNA modification methylase
VETYFDTGEGQDWANLLVWGDNLYIMRALLPRLRNAIQFIYIDPPFYTGTAETIDIPRGIRPEEASSGYAQVRDVAYANVWEGGNPAETFAQWFYARARLMRTLLRPAGFLAVRFDYHFGHYAKMVLDRVFGMGNFVGEFLVRRMDKTVSKKALATQKHLIVQHDSLFLYRKSAAARLFQFPEKMAKPGRDPYESANAADNIWTDIDGYEKKKKTYYPTENSVALLSRAIRLCSQEGDIVADFFAGSGTTLYAAATLGRRWVGADINLHAINEMRKRMLQQAERAQAGASVSPLHVLDVAGYRSHAVASQITPSIALDPISPPDYVAWVVRQFGGQVAPALAPGQLLHGHKEGAALHVGSLEMSVMPHEIRETLAACEESGTTSLVVLGWRYCLDVDFFRQLREQEGSVQVDLRVIPRQLLNEHTESAELLLPFPKLPLLDFDLNIDADRREATLAFTHYYAGAGPAGAVVDDLDLLDFWAVDWDAQFDTPLHGQDYSFRRMSGKGRRLGEHAARLAVHQYTSTGEHIAHLVIFDIFGNITSEYARISFPK